MLSSTTKLEISEDEEIFQEYQKCVNLLVAAGFFKARVKNLSAFDKIVGGIVYCISTCNYSVDVDLLYAENSTIGQKIALTEQIVEVLVAFKCPHALEPHQIQGLDVHAIYPVLQWLVKKSIEAKELYGDRIQAFADFLARSSDEKPRIEGRQFPKTKVKDEIKRHFKRTGGEVSTLYEDLECTLREFSLSQDDSLEAVQKLVESSGSSKPSEAITHKLISKEELEQLGMSRMIVEAEVSEESLDAEIELAKRELERYTGEKMEEEQSLAKNEAERLETIEYGDLEEDLEKGLDPELRSTFTSYLLMSEREAEFKEKCQAEIEKLDADIEKADEIQHGIEEDDIRQAREKLEKEKAKLVSAQEQCAEKVRETARLQRAIDAHPSQIELLQYHRRLIELYNQMGTKHRQTRQLYAYHNSLVDLRNYLSKEAELLNSIEEALSLVRHEDNRDTFLSQLDKILRGVEAGLTKLERKSEDIAGNKEILTVQLNHERDKERALRRAFEDIEKACAEVAELNQRISARALTIE